MIDDYTLDHLLARSTPRPVHPVDCPDCRAAAQPDPRPARGLRVAGSLAAASALVGVAGAAAAVVGLPFLSDPVSGTRTVDSGASCLFTFDVEPRQVPADSPNVVAAAEILSRINIGAIDVTGAVREQEEYFAAHPDDVPTPPAGTREDMIERTAVFMVVTQRVHDELAAQGLGSQGVSIVETDSCDTAS